MPVSSAALKPSMSSLEKAKIKAEQRVDHHQREKEAKFGHDVDAWRFNFRAWA